MELRGFLRALAGAAAWGLVALAEPARAHPPADDYQPYQPSGFFVFDWSGYYVGGSLGLAHANAEATETILAGDVLVGDILGLEDLNFGQSETSITGGVHAGWQKHWGKMVLGGELGISLIRFDNTTVSPLIDGLNRSVAVGNLLTLSGRLGYADGRWLAYAKAGVASADVDVSYHDTVDGGRSSRSGRELGWVGGIGIDYALAPNVFLGVEYNYLHFRAGVDPPFLPDFPEAQFSGLDIDIQTLAVRLSYRFGTECCQAPSPRP